ncbi:MAG: NAD(P)/FAD-dependent oxidoreductase [Planctomycetaceae bacterium]
MEHCDVLIVGGGPAGSSCARALRAAGAGLDVLIIDKKPFPRDKTCAGWVTPPVLDLLDVDIDDYRRGRTLQPITGFRTGMIGGHTVLTTYPEPASYGIRRCEFDHYLLERSNARSRLGEPVRSLVRDGQCWLVNDEIRTALLIGAGGHFCPVARLLGGRELADSSVVAAQEIEFAATADQLGGVRVEPEIPELYFCEDLQGYGWCFRKGDFLNIGLGRVDPQGLSSHLADFCEYLRSSGRVDCDIPARFHGHAYQLYERVQPKLVDDGALLIGDAAGLAYAQSGEGIRPAVESGLIAADVILQAQGNYERSTLDSYRRRIIERFGTPRSGSVAGWLPAGCLRVLAARLMATQWFSRHVVLDRWFLHSGQAALSL